MKITWIISRIHSISCRILYAHPYAMSLSMLLLRQNSHISKCNLLSWFIAHNRWAPNETIFLSSRENIATISNLINSIKRFAVIDYDYLIAYSLKWVQQLATPTTLIDPVDKSVDSLDGKCAFVLIQINDVDGLWQPKWTNSKSIVLSSISWFIFNTSPPIRSPSIRNGASIVCHSFSMHFAFHSVRMLRSFFVCRIIWHKIINHHSIFMGLILAAAYGPIKIALSQIQIQINWVDYIGLLMLNYFGR